MHQEICQSVFLDPRARDVDRTVVSEITGRARTLAFFFKHMDTIGIGDRVQVGPESYSPVLGKLC